MTRSDLTERFGENLIELGSVPTAFVLIVDDEPIVLRALRRVLAGVARVECATCPEEALWKVASVRFDAVVTDFQMGVDRDGLWLLERVRLHDDRIRRVLVSGSSPEIFKPHVRSGLVHAFVPKPATPAAVVKAITARSGAA